MSTKHSSIKSLHHYGVLLFLIFVNAACTGAAFSPRNVVTPSCTLTDPGVEAFLAGTGLVGDPYEIHNAAQLNNVRNFLSSYFILEADIDMECVLFSPLGEDTNTAAGFQGSVFDGGFDGDGHTISNLTITAPGKDYIGLFGYLGGFPVHDLTISNANISGEELVGVLAGISGTAVSGVYVSGTVVATSSSAGGMIGENNGTLSDAGARVNVTGTTTVGGLMGFDNGASTTTRVFATGDVVGSAGDVGGLIGSSFIECRYCFATGNVTGSVAVGGLIGTVLSADVRDSFATGNVTGEISVGGLVGSYTGGLGGNDVMDCYATGDITRVGALSPNLGGLLGNLGGTGVVTTSYKNSDATISMGVDVPTVHGTALSEAQMAIQGNWVGFTFGAGNNDWVMPAVSFKLPGETVDYSFPIMNWVNSLPSF